MPSDQRSRGELLAITAEGAGSVPWWGTQLSSVQSSRSVVSDSAAPWTAARQVPLSITNSQCLLGLSPSSGWCHPTTSSSVVPFSSCLQSFPASGCFQMSRLRPHKRRASAKEEKKEQPGWQQSRASSWSVRDTYVRSVRDTPLSPPHLGACAKSLQSCPVFATPWTVARQLPLSVEFSRQEYLSGLAWGFNSLMNGRKYLQIT